MFQSQIQRQIKDIRKGGVPVFFRKVYTFLLMVLPILLVPLIFLVRVLRPLVLIRFGGLISSRIGHFAANTELYLCERDIMGNSKRTFDIFYHMGPICNQQLKKMWERVLPVFGLACYLDKANRIFPGWQRHTIHSLSLDRGREGFFTLAPTHLFFAPQEERLGQETLQALGIPLQREFVCFYSRDPAYLETVLPNEDWRYHNYRNSSIHNYICAAEELMRRGYFAVRMGFNVKEPLAIINPMIIDYAVQKRSDFMDIYLGAKCRFFFSCTGGISAVSSVFRRPIVYVNLIPLELLPGWNDGDLFIPKKLWLSSEHRFLSFREIIESGIGRFYRSQEYEQMGIEVIENTPEEIKDVVAEMEERLKGRWQTSQEDEELQQSFRSLIKPSDLNRTVVSRMGAEFLRQNRNLLN